MATSRTGTAKYKRNTQKALNQARANGITNCPRCNRTLDWTRSGTASSVEADHIIPHALGGTDDTHNFQPLCRTCNRSAGGKLGRQRQLARQRRTSPRPTGKLPTSGTW